MTRIKLCGLTRPCDIDAANVLKTDYVGFVFAPDSRRCVSPEAAAVLRKRLRPEIQAVGVFVNEAPETIAALLHQGVIQLAQLHGSEDEAYISRLRSLSNSPIIQAFRIDNASDVLAAQASSADYVLLDSGSGGTGTSFDWTLAHALHRPYFLAGGLNPANVAQAIAALHPYAVDVSSGVETDRVKDPTKMQAFVHAACNK